MKTYWVYEQVMHASQLNDELVEVILASEVREESEKAKKEVWNDRWAYLKAECEKARAEERERISRKLKYIRTWYHDKDWPREHALTMALEVVEHPSSSFQPAPLEKLHPEGKEGGVFAAIEVANVVNALVDRVNELAQEMKRGKTK